MTDINKQIEEESKQILFKANKLPPEANYFGSVDHIKYSANEILKLSEELKHSSRWQKFGVDDLPRLEQQIICRGGDKYHLAKPISHDGIHWLAEHFIEWKPID